MVCKEVALVDFKGCFDVYLGRGVNNDQETRTVLLCRPRKCRASQLCLLLGPVACTSCVLEL